MELVNIFSSLYLKVTNQVFPTAKTELRLRISPRYIKYSNVFIIRTLKQSLTLMSFASSLSAPRYFTMMHLLINKVVENFSNAKISPDWIIYSSLPKI